MCNSPTGFFTGSFLIPNTDTSLVRKSTFRGLIVWTGTQYRAPGYFPLAQAPQPRETVTTSSVLSGHVVLEPAP